MGEQISFKRDPSFSKCPECNAVGKLRRSHPRSVWEKSLRNLGFISYYRCKECGWRGPKFNFGIQNISLKTVLIYLGLMLATAAIVRFVVQRILMK